MRIALLIAAKDLRSDVRAKEIAPTMVLFALLLTFLFTFALPPGSGSAPIPLPAAGAVASREVIAVLFWIGLLFAGIVGFGRNASLEKEGNRIEGLLMAPIDPMAIFLGKAAANFTYLSVTEAVVLPLFILFFDVSAGLLFPEIVSVLLLGNIGMAATGTLFAASSQYARAREVILPLLAFPVLLPLILAGSRLTTSLLIAGELAGEARWLILMASFDLAISAVGAVSFEYVIQE